MTATEQPTMSGAELKTTLGGLGIPPSWLAARMSVTMRTVVRWFDSDVVSPQVVAAVEWLCAATEAETMCLLNAVDKRKSTIVLSTYRTDEQYNNVDGLPATWHRQVVFRLMEQLKAEGKTVTVQYG